MYNSIRACGAASRLLEHAQRVVEHVGDVAGVAVEVQDGRVLAGVLALYQPAVHELSWAGAAES